MGPRFLESSVMLGAASRRSIVGALAALCVTCQAQVTPPPSHAEGEPPPEAAPPPGLDPSIARVDPGSPLGRARARLAAGDAAGAREQALAAIERASEDERGELRWIAARAAAAAGDDAAAIASLAEIDAPHPLAPWARLEAARLELGRDPSAAIARLAPLLAREDEATLPPREEARALDALARARAGEEDADARLRAAIDRATGATRASLERALADRLAARADDVAAREEAIALLRWIDARRPGTREGREAAARAGELLAALPEARRRALAQPSVEQQIARADALAAAMDHRGAEEAYAAIAARLRPARRTTTAGSTAAESTAAPSTAGESTAAASTAAEAAEAQRLRCEVRLGQGRALYRRRARREAVSLLVPLAEECRAHTDVRAWSRYYAAKSYSGLDLEAEAIAQYDVLAEELPAHRLADDALINAARIAAERGDQDGARARLTRIVEQIADGDMRGEARFLLAWEARRAGALDDALAHLDAALAEGAGEHGEDVRGRAAYWRGRVLEQLGRAADAASQYDSLARALPLSYYAQHALARLTALDEARARAALPAPPGEGAPAPLRFARRPEVASTAFARAVALLRVGEHRDAEDELRASGLLADDAPPDALWIAAALLDRAGEHSAALELARRRLRESMMSTMPEGRARSLWRIAYPRAYAPLIDSTAESAGVPASFVRAIAREESSFRADAVSVAHAYGLCQIIRPTAQRMARPLGLPSDPAALRTPEVNVAIGARYMSWLRARYDPQPALVPAAYNAGEGAVDRWLRERGDRELDEFIEEIPYDETRRYSRRVLQTWGVYAWLDEGALPSWPRALPSR